MSPVCGWASPMAASLHESVKLGTFHAVITSPAPSLPTRTSSSGGFPANARAVSTALRTFSGDKCASVLDCWRFSCSLAMRAESSFSSDSIFLARSRRTFSTSASRRLDFPSMASWICALKTLPTLPRSSRMASTFRAARRRNSPSPTMSPSSKSREASGSNPLPTGCQM